MIAPRLPRNPKCLCKMYRMAWADCTQRVAVAGGRKHATKAGCIYLPIGGIGRTSPGPQTRLRPALRIGSRQSRDILSSSRARSIRSSIRRSGCGYLTTSRVDAIEYARGFLERKGKMILTSTAGRAKDR